MYNVNAKTGGAGHRHVEINRELHSESRDRRRIIPPSRDRRRAQRLGGKREEGRGGQ